MINWHVRRRGITITLLALSGMAFYAVSDPRIGVTPMREISLVQAVREASVGTWMGLAGCGIVLLVGLYMLVRKAI